MFGYHFSLALYSLKRNVVLTSLMIAAIAVGIGASMTTLTVFREMSRDPIPGKSSQLYVSQIDNWGPDKHGSGSTDILGDQLSYVDAVALMRALAASRQSAMYKTGLALTPTNPQLRPFQVGARAAYKDFFSMFQVPFKFGGPWSAADDESHAALVVISRKLNDRLFGGADSIGKIVTLDNQDYRIVGVLTDWTPMPRYYDLHDKFGADAEDVLLPFTRAIDEHMQSRDLNCNAYVVPGWEGLLRSECVWIQFWVELPSARDAGRYRAFLTNYASEQQHSGRFHWPPSTKLRNVQQLLSDVRVVSDEVQILVIISFSFLFICLLNAMGLMLAKIMSRSGDIGIRRALGATRRAVFAQYLTEATVIGAAGGILGLLLTALGLAALRSLLSKAVLALTQIDAADVCIAIGLALAAAVLAGLYPSWRATRVQPAWHLKVQ